jgi:hypothetical protein
MFYVIVVFNFIELCSTVNPEWSDDSRFYFIVEDESKFMFSV